MQKRRHGGISLLLGTLAFLSSAASRANADGMTLAQGGIDGNFTLSTFASGFPFDSTNNIGPLGIAFPSGGGVLVTDSFGAMRLFPSASDGQNASSASLTFSYGRNLFPGITNAAGLARIGNSIYMASQGNNSLIQLNANGTPNQTLFSGLLNHPTGIVADPSNGHLFISTANGTSGTLYEVNPATGTRSIFKTGDFDGLAISQDGTKIYAASEDHVVGFDIASGNQIYTSNTIAGTPDGVALGMGNLAGNIFVNTNDGTLVEVNLSSGAQTLIGTGGSRGDFVISAPDGSLLLTQTDRILRLTPPSGSGFVTPLIGGGDPVTPEPSSLALLGLGGLALLGWRRWQSFSG
jgi:DNA-binding beta-propeller fold protein YncE